MRYALYILLCIALLPVFAHAQIRSSTQASSNTGGNVVGPGGIIVEGDSSASVQVTTTSGQGSSSIYIKTEANGTVHEEVIEDASGKVEVSVEAQPGKAQVEIQQAGKPAVHKVVDTSASSSAALQASTSAVAQVPPTVEPLAIIGQIFAWLGGLFSFWL